MSKQKITWSAKEVSIDLLDPSPKNWKLENKLGLERFKQSVSEFGRAGTRICNLGSKGRFVLIDGNSNLADAKSKGEKKVWISIPSRALTVKEFDKMCKVFDMSVAGDVDLAGIAASTDNKEFFKQYKQPVPARLLDTLGAKADVKLDKDNKPIKESIVLREKWIEPPFSVLDTRQGSWQERKRAWIEYGIKGEVAPTQELVEVDNGKKIVGKSLLFSIPTKKYANKDEYFDEGSRDLNTSIFDPALCELMYTWFCKKGGAVLDPFAGGPSRGVVAGYMGLKYFGLELSQKQVRASEANARELLVAKKRPTYYCGDSDKLLDKKWSTKFDFLFSCPPYFNLEVYSKDKDDLSNMTYDKFLAHYRSIVLKSCKLLKLKSYACFVISPVRGKDGSYYDLVGDTVDAFQKAGLVFYNDAILLNMIGSASMRADKQFTASKKLVRVHQNVLIFYKP
jgi:DNA modification methylase